MRSIALVLSLSLAPAAASQATGWAVDAELRARTTAEVTVKPAPRYQLNLDLPQSQRWNDIAALYKVRAERWRCKQEGRWGISGSDQSVCVYIC